MGALEFAKQANDGVYPMYVYTSFDGRNLKRFKCLLLSVVYPSSMCPLILNKMACNWITQHLLAMGRVMCLWGLGPGQRSRDRQRSRCVSVCGSVVWCGVQYSAVQYSAVQYNAVQCSAVQCVYGTHTSWLLQVANHLDSVQIHCLHLIF